MTLIVALHNSFDVYKQNALQSTTHEPRPYLKRRNIALARRLLRCHKSQPPQTKKHQVRYLSIYSVLTSAAMLGVNYPKDAQINHKVINALDLPSFKMTPYFQEAFEFI